MRYLKYVLLLASFCGILGTVAVPFAELESIRVYAIQIPVHGPILLAAFLVPLVLVGVCIFFGTRRWAVIVSALGFLIAGFKCVGDGLGVEAFGHTLALFSAFAGMILSVALTIRPDQARLLRAPASAEI
jgi:hypothetical protein